MVRPLEIHFTHRVGWLRAAVLGANDGIVSTASLIVGVAAAEASRSSVLVAGVAGLVAFLNPAGRTAVLPFNTRRTGLVRTPSQPWSTASCSHSRSARSVSGNNQ